MPFSRYVSNMVFMPPELEKILRETPELQRAFLVGGSVRDVFLGRPPGQDFDIEVFGLDYDRLRQALARWGRTDLVGRSFGVVKLSTGSGQTYDFTVPRKDSKVAPGHKGFDVEFDPAITPPEAAARRDFTINSLMYDPRAGQVLDFFGGAADLKNRVLRHTSPAFSEDPLRVLRGMQFAGRFDLRAAPETAALSRQIKGSFPELAVERVREEWFKWAQQGGRPSAGLRFLIDTEWIDHFPEIKALAGTPQEPEWHPEGDVFTHTCHACDALARLDAWLAADAESRLVYMLAVLAHDFGKPATTQTSLKEGRQRLVSPGHDEAGAELAKIFLERLRAQGAIVERVVPLVRNHLFYHGSVTDRAVRRLAKRLEPESVEGLCLVMTADSMGRPPLPALEPESVQTLLARARDLNVRAKPPEPILMGRHLIEAGLRPGKDFAGILGQAYDAQLEGAFGDLPGAFAWLAGSAAFAFSEDVKTRLRARAEGAA
ncbi:MAG: HD domain-containing protein [Verrucomicrobiota bacterium]|jgi:tRNA nucleotidyltransferase (CCA-adding enzyme)